MLFCGEGCCLTFCKVFVISLPTSQWDENHRHYRNSIIQKIYEKEDKKYVHCFICKPFIIVRYTRMLLYGWWINRLTHCSYMLDALFVFSVYYVFYRFPFFTYWETKSMYHCFQCCSYSYLDQFWWCGRTVSSFDWCLIHGIMIGKGGQLA